ncbi:hypothetical protein KBD61_01960 [Patescibacteria group bacterium]|nr:hypothetical protein [Patescibacteria group bacterium]MBP9709775.1 hypothetical protein [Patescibacteria group bacterium]
MAKSEIPENFRIHGDNILECETALKLVCEAFGVEPKIADGPAYAPLYEVPIPAGNILIRLLPGYGRWSVDIQKHIAHRGGVLREATDAIITQVKSTDDDYEEVLLIAFEFCGALPAGNNAWQRCGRALAMAYAKIPYLYFAEIGGLELDEDRKIKAPRFPNPLIPYGYLTLGVVEQTMALPIFMPSPTISSENTKRFADAFGKGEALKVIKAIFTDEDSSENIKVLHQKARQALAILSSLRKKNDVLEPDEWRTLDQENTGEKKAIWLLDRKMPWHKKTGIGSLNASFKNLLKKVTRAGAVAAGSKDMPLCVLGSQSRRELGAAIEKIYSKRVSESFVTWVKNGEHPLVCVWIAGFKPRGDDSRPDRGLVPLARMVFGRKNVDVLSIIYGPGKESAWKRFQTDMFELARTNGLWESVLKLSDAVLIDSPTSRKMGNVGFVLEGMEESHEEEQLPLASLTPSFGEHDVDSVIHLIFSNSVNECVFEGLCNPPGGDWSGVSLYDFKGQLEFRWTSLPRVSGEMAKRPDHLIQFMKGEVLLALESKDTVATLEEKIGKRLVYYVKKLIEKPPIISRKNRLSSWFFQGLQLINEFNIISGAAIRYTDEACLHRALKHGEVDIVLAVEFDATHQVTTIHVMATKNVKLVKEKIVTLASRFGSWLQVKTYQA